MVVYTKKGDGGKTALYDRANSQRNRVSKNSSKIEALGAIDELNSFIGIVITDSWDTHLKGHLTRVQKNLLTIGSILAGSNLRFFASKTKKLEELIDELEGSLPVLKNFILPGGSSVSSKLHYARSLTRRAERKVVSLNETKTVKPQILTYLNRLSDYLFMLARKSSFDDGFEDEVWRRS